MAIDLAPANPYSLEIATPLLAAAGSLGYGVEAARALGLGGPAAGHGLGALVTRTTTLEPRRARPLPALAESPAGLIYSGDEHNPGLRAVLKRYAPAWAGWALPVIVSVGGAADEAAELAAALEEAGGVAGVELPLAALGAPQPEAARRLVARVRAACQLPLIAKLPGDAADIAGLAAAAVAGGADAIALIDGLPARGPAGEGRLCGPALRPLALRAVGLARAAVGVPIIGGGGVSGPADALALLEAGASAVALGSALLLDTRAAARIADALGGR